MSKSRGEWWCSAVVIALLATGCGQQSGTSTAEAPAATRAGSVPPLASISAQPQSPSGEMDLADNNEPEAGEVTVAAPTEGTPEWLIREIVHLKVSPLGQTAQRDDATGETASLTEERKSRNHQIVELATQAIAMTHDKPESEHLFNAAVHHLLESRLQLALQGEQESIDSLYEETNALHRRGPKSKAAAEASLTLVNFAYSNAQRFAAEEPRWLDEFAKQALLYARNFPDEKNRAIPLVIAAAQSCELHGQQDVAARCFRMIADEYPQHAAAGQATAALRRLELKGRPLELAGPTIDGNFVSIEDYRDRPVLVIFWNSHAQKFAEQLTALEKIDEQFGDELKILGVNLDTNEAAIDAFLEQTKLRWSQIFYSEADKRGWKHPAAVYYGISNVPTYWLVNRQGVVVETQPRLENLAELINRMQ